MREWNVAGLAAGIGVLAAFALIAIGVARHPAGVRGAGGDLLWKDAALLVAYAAAASWVSRQGRADVRRAIHIGTVAGLSLGCVLVANHLIELLILDRNLALVLCPVFLALGLFGAAGSSAWRSTRSVALAAAAGLWCAVFAMLILLCWALTLKFLSERLAEGPIRGAIAANQVTDVGAYLLSNSLEAAFEGLVRFPAFGLILAIIGALVSAAVSRWSRLAALTTAVIAPLALGLGASALWHADSLVRSARPPFVMGGILLVSVALCAVHPIWATVTGVRHDGGRAKGRVIGG